MCVQSCTHIFVQMRQLLLKRRNRLQQLRFLCTGDWRNICCNTRAAATATPITTSQQTATASLHLHPTLVQHLLQHESCNTRHNVATDCNSLSSSAPVTRETSTATRELQQPQRLLKLRNRLQQLCFIRTHHLHDNFVAFVKLCVFVRVIKKKLQTSGILSLVRVHRGQFLGNEFQNFLHVKSWIRGHDQYIGKKASTCLFSYVLISWVSFHIYLPHFL